MVALSSKRHRALSSASRMELPWRIGLFLNFISYCVSTGNDCVVGVAGGSSVLFCVYGGARGIQGRYLAIEWRTGGALVHGFVTGADQLGHQDPLYSNRTQLFPAGLQEGNFSLRLSGIMAGDAQDYGCYFTDSGEGPLQHLCSVCLAVAVDRSGRGSGLLIRPASALTSGRTGWEGMWLCGTVLCVMVAILVAGVLLYQNRLDRKSERTPQADQENLEAGYSEGIEED
nr:PREDICTED: CD276 antigen-like isoform X2 [Lepisosteus oculatus]